jgi:hypothetical protein
MLECAWSKAQFPESANDTAAARKVAHIIKKYLFTAVPFSWIVVDGGVVRSYFKNEFDAEGICKCHADPAVFWRGKHPRH